MVPARTLNPVWSPDSKYVAYASHLQSLYHAIFVANVETGENHQVTDGLADSVWPIWDNNGKYLWFLASTDLGLKSQWLDMTSYDHDEHFGLYLAVLSKGGASPLLPESDEDPGVNAPSANNEHRAAEGAEEKPGEHQSKRKSAGRGYGDLRFRATGAGVAAFTAPVPLRRASVFSLPFIFTTAISRR